MAAIIPGSFMNQWTDSRFHVTSRMWVLETRIQKCVQTHGILCNSNIVIFQNLTQVGKTCHKEVAGCWHVQWFSPFLSMGLLFVLSLFFWGVKHHPIFWGLKSFRRKQEPPDCWIRGVISSYTHLQPTSSRVYWDEKSHLQPGISSLYWHNILPSLFFQRQNV